MRNRTYSIESVGTFLTHSCKKRSSLPGLALKVSYR